MIVLGLLLMSAQPATMFDADKAPDPELARHRGGLRLPNGVDVALSVQTTTAVDGAIVLETVWKVDKDQPSLAVYSPTRGSIVPSGVRKDDRAATGSPTSASVTYDRQHGLQMTTSGWRPAVNVSAAGEAPRPTPGLEQVDPSMPAETDAGVVSSTAPGRLPGVQLVGADIQVTHLNGMAFGSVIENSGSDRIIDTQTTLSIDLRNAGPDVVGSAFLRIDGIATDALAGRIGS